MDSGKPLQVHAGEGYLAGVGFSSPATKKWAEAKVGKPSLYNYESRSSRYASLVLSKHFGSGVATTGNSGRFAAASNPPPSQAAAPVTCSSPNTGGNKLLSDDSSAVFGSLNSSNAAYNSSSFVTTTTSLTSPLKQMSGSSQEVLEVSAGAEYSTTIGGGRTPSSPSSSCYSPSQSQLLPQNDPSLRKYHRRWTKDQTAILSPHAAEKIRHQERKAKAEAAVSEVLARGHRNVQVEFKLSHVIHEEEKVREDTVFKEEPTGRREVYAGFYWSLLSALCDEESSCRSQIAAEVSEASTRDESQGGFHYIRNRLDEMVRQHTNEKEKLADQEASARLLIGQDSEDPVILAAFQNKRDQLDDMFTELENERAQEHFLLSEENQRRDCSSGEIMERAALVLHLQALILDLRKAQSHHLMEVVEEAKATVPGGRIWGHSNDPAGFHDDRESDDISPVPSGGFPEYEDSFNFSVSLNGSAKNP